MTRPHDMGGQSGGRVIPAPDGIPAYDAPWHRTALGLTLAAGGLGGWTIDESRAARERLKDYPRFSYYEKWIAALAGLLVEKGFVTEEELAAGTAVQAPLSPRAFMIEKVAPALARGTPYSRPGPAPRFAVGDRVTTRRPAANAFVGRGHTRLPAYAEGKPGRVILSHGPHVFPDRNAHGLGEAPEPLYTILFRAADLWEAPEDPEDEVTLDLWESYLVPA
ncbi:nitrile hydratase subunit beta [Frigidibacter sp. SD6-1]|uniref:nitrile hydratase subunit beta n=1 Tax=Frigidibacter sp. SD6-1 TaxID=3032581 RepID=UPI0024DF30AA|nr:nitrile hydratase subunit beta [Frigidibacter sp. SD6-1]